LVENLKIQKCYVENGEGLDSRARILYFGKYPKNGWFKNGW
jgi:hypothetical protein